MTNPDTLLALPIVIPLIAVVACVLFWKHVAVQRIVTGTLLTAHLLGAILLLRLVSREGIVTTQIGTWPAPFGIVLVGDLLSAIMVLVGAIVGLAVAVYSFASIDSPREAHGYYPLYNALLMGVSGAFLTGDIFNLYVWFEVTLLASFVLMALGGARPQLDGATKYVTLNLLGSIVLLSAVGLLYGFTGTLNMAQLSLRLSDVEHSGMVVALAVMFLLAFGTKAALFPLFFWLPDSYHTPPVAISALFAGLLTKVGVYALIRTFTLLFTQNVAFTHTLILVLSGLTMLTGVLGAVANKSIGRILSFHIVSQIGYMTMGLGLFSRLALAGSVFYIVHHIIVKTNLFLIGGVVERLRGTSQLDKLGGLYEERPFLSALFLVPALALAGAPPLSGFWAKLFLIQAGLELGRPVIVAIALVVGLLTLLSMTKIWKEAFWSPSPPASAKPAQEVRVRIMMAPALVLASLTILMGVFIAPTFDLALRAADQILDPTRYVRAVLGEAP